VAAWELLQLLMSLPHRRAASMKKKDDVNKKGKPEFFSDDANNMQTRHTNLPVTYYYLKVCRKFTLQQCRRKK
jgi:hypothetical protein